MRTLPAPNMPGIPPVLRMPAIPAVEVRQPVSFYRRYQRVRLQKWLASGRTFPALDDKPLFMIEKTGYRPPWRLAEDLKRLCRGLRIIHDPLTHGEGTAGGLHLYRVVRGFHGLFWILLQRVPEWEDGAARPPGPWLCDWFRENDKARHEGDWETIVGRQMVDNILSEQSRQASIEARDEEAIRYCYADIWAHNTQNARLYNEIQQRRRHDQERLLRARKR